MGWRIFDYNIYMEPSRDKSKTVAIVLGLLLLMGVMVNLYMKDSKTVQEANVVRAYVVNFCMENARYPSKEEFDKRYPKLAADPDWSYRPGKDLKSGTFQYPPPLFSASGDNGTVSNPCQVFNTEVF